MVVTKSRTAEEYDSMDRQASKPGKGMQWMSQIDIMSQEDLSRTSSTREAPRASSKDRPTNSKDFSTPEPPVTSEVDAQKASPQGHEQAHEASGDRRRQAVPAQSPETAAHVQPPRRSSSNASYKAAEAQQHYTKSPRGGGNVHDEEDIHDSHHEDIHHDSDVDHEDVPSEGSVAAMQDSMAKSIVMSQQLEMLTERMPISGQAVSAIIRLMDLCVAARPVAQNARELARLCLDVIDIIEDLVDFEEILTANLFKELHKAFQTAAAHVELFVRAGWLIHLALMDDVRGHFESIHQLIVDILEASVPAEHLGEVLAHKRRYTDPARPLLRVLRQIGHGDVVDGMYAAKADTVHVHAIVHALTPPSVSGVDQVAVLKELKGLPPKSKNIDLERMYRTGATGSLSEVKGELGPKAVSGLKRVYKAFATYGQRYNGATGLDGARFMKLAQDSGLVGRGQRLNRSDVDIVFAKTRTKGERVLSFEQFVEALDALGQRCNCSLADIASQVLESGGPITRGTVAEGVRFYDDKSTYTGTWAHGGGPPTNYDGAKDLGTQLSRDIKAERRRRSRLQGDDLTMGRGSPGMVSPQPYGGEYARKSSGKSAAPSDNIFSKFIAFAVFGKGAAMAEQAAADPGSVLLDSKGFAKFCKESRIMRGRLDLTRVDLIFTKFCNKATKRMSYAQFSEALYGCAEARGIDLEELKDEIDASEGPANHGTQAEAVRFHDNHSKRTTVKDARFANSNPPSRPQVFTEDGRPIWEDRG